MFMRLSQSQRSSEPQSFRPLQQVPDGGRVPSCAATGRSFMHSGELRGDLLESGLRGRGLDAGDQADEVVITAPRPGAVEQGVVDDALGGEPAHGASEPLRGPWRVALAGAAVQHPRDIAPGLIGTHAAYDRKPRIEPSQNALEMRRVAACPNLADRLRVTGAKAGIAADAPTRTGGIEAGLGAFGDQAAFELGDGAEDLEREHALGGGGIDRVAQAAEMRARGLELLDDGEKMADGAGETVEPHDDEGIAAANVAKDAGEHRPAAIGAGGVLLKDFVAAGGVEFVALRVGVLSFGGDPGVADEAARGRGFTGKGWHGPRFPRCWGRFYKFMTAM